MYIFRLLHTEQIGKIDFFSLVTLISKAKSLSLRTLSVDRGTSAD